MILANKTIMITGANGGLGEALTKEALKLGAKKVYCCARDTNKAKFLEQLDKRVELCSLDISEKQSVQTLASSIKGVDILINNAGVNSGKRILEKTTSDFDVNFFGTLNMCRMFNDKITNGGAIINISSILALVNLPVMGLYCASKSALHSATQALRAEFSLKGIEVYEVFAGPIDTAMSEELPMDKTKPEDIAQAIYSGYQAKTFEIFPDAIAQGMREGLKHDPKAVEAECAQSIKH